MCGIVGFYGKPNIVYDLMLGLSALQHRGQDAAGIITFEKSFHIKKGLGLVNDVFAQRHADRLRGNIGLGHVRYTTHGSNELINAQPIAANYPFGIAMVHNGNVSNFEEVHNRLYKEYHILPATSNDLELLLYTFSSELNKKDLAQIGPADIFDAVSETQKKVHGAYSVIAAIANHGLLAFCDPNGIRPLVLGQKEGPDGQPVYGFASESVCFDHLGYTPIRELKAGEIVFIDENRQLHSSLGHKTADKFCVFEFIYFAREDSELQGKLVAGQRVKMGRMLAQKVREMGLEADMVIDVPSSGYFAASGLAEALDIPYKRGLVKSNYIGRSFISPSQVEREALVKRKLNPIARTIKGKKLLVVDDSIVRGTTSKRIVQILREAGAEKVYFVSAAPAIKHPCIYGIDMSVSTELLAVGRSDEEICDYIGADALIYQKLEDLKAIFEHAGFCMACLDGAYPTPAAKEALAQIEAERLAIKK
ncbi:amidophosphoribosyltransferase [Saprospira grandis]|uniref:Amidophosphoribosyltransferase n=1 Tax=Saprospira grandis (strain Lewin) TaxID=984262 RepID=H6LAZ2_SAPGL|nr:amidophosphoribosyltransferase [Saprospira grandis]AFC26957.1 amidophosphoribosyltransferase [Saprospira grandis str. Lewin]